MYQEEREEILTEREFEDFLDFLNRIWEEYPEDLSKDLAGNYGVFYGENKLL